MTPNITIQSRSPSLTIHIKPKVHQKLKQKYYIKDKMRPEPDSLRITDKEQNGEKNGILYK